MSARNQRSDHLYKKGIHFGQTRYGAISMLPAPESVEGSEEHCVGCPYPRHGATCRNQDGSCLHTEMQEIYNRGRKRK